MKVYAIIGKDPNSDETYLAGGSLTRIKQLPKKIILVIVLSLITI